MMLHGFILRLSCLWRFEGF